MPAFALAPPPSHSLATLAQSGGKPQTNVNASATANAHGSSSVGDAFADSMSETDDEEIKKLLGDDCSSEELADYIRQICNLLSQCVCQHEEQQQEQQDDDSQHDTIQTGGSSTDTSGEDVGNDISTLSSIETLDRNRSLWMQNNGGGNYTYTLIERQGDNGASNRVSIEVNNNRLASGGNGALTIDQIFDLARESALRGERADVIYHPRLGYPEFVFLGNERDTTADNISYTLRDVDVA